MIRRTFVLAVAQRAAVPVGLLLSAVLVWQTSYAAFTATTSNPSNSFAAGNVVLADNDSNAAMFTLTGVNAMKPGDSVSRCIRVTYGTTGLQNLPMTIKMYSSGYSSPTGSGGGVLGTSLNITVDVSADQSFTFPTCPAISGATTVFDSATPASQGTNAGKLEKWSSYTDWASGISGQWSTPSTSTSTVARIYRITASLPSDAPDTMQDASASINFWWEAQNA